jgi:hypothetical protein
MSKDEGIYIRCTHTKEDDMLVYQSTDAAVGFIITSTELDENVAITADHVGVRKLRDYLNEILGDVPTTQPATGKPVAWRYKERPDDMRSSWCYAHKRKSVPAGWPFQELFTSAPPAAVHGDERAAFEEWAQGFGWAATEMTWQVDRYLDEDLQLQWSGWQARAAMRAQGEHGEPK